MKMRLCPINYYSSKKVWGGAFHHWGYTRKSRTPLPLNSPDFHQKQQDEMLNLPRVLISLSNTRNENHIVLQQPWRHFASLKQYHCSQIPQPSPRVASNSNRTKTPINGLIVYKHSTRTKLHHLTRETTQGKLRQPWGNTSKPWTHLPPSFPWLTTETKRWNLRSAQRFHFVWLHQEQTEELSPW